MKKASIIIGVACVGIGAVLFANATKSKGQRQPASEVSSPEASKKEVTHEFHHGETLWFLANVYYGGQGKKYTDIMEANHLKNTEDVKEGMMLVIPGTTWDVSSTEFKQRYQTLWDHRKERKEAKEAQAKSMSEKESVAVAAVEKVETKAEKQVEKQVEHKNEKIAETQVEVKIQKPAQKISHKQASNNDEKQDVMVVPIPSSPIFQADPKTKNLPANPHPRTASEVPAN